MRIALDHSKILKEIMTAGFRRGMEESLIPALSEKFGSALECVMMYEDYLEDNFVFGGYRYYPLTLVVAGAPKTLWIKWDVQKSSLYESGNPYAYLGESLDFDIAADTPIAFENAMADRVVYAPDGYVKINVSAAVKDFSVLSGKYSQAFIDEMARQLTAAIEKSAAVLGLAESSIELTVFFAPDTYMEHTSENVTYRRLLISAKGSAPRDLWIKWTRLDSNAAFSVKDFVSADTIRFELGEDVSHKIREKEYRFLVYSNPEKYRMAMGRKNVVEWRELIKRAVKKGELMKLNGSFEDDKHVTEVSDKLAEILERAGVAAPTFTLSDDFKDDTSEVERALRMAIAGSSAPAVSTPTAEATPALDMGDAEGSGDEDEFPLPDSTTFDFGDGSDDEDEDSDTPEEPEIIEIVKPAASPAPIAVAEPEIKDEPSDKRDFDLMVDIQTLEARLKIEKEETEKAILDKELCERKLEVALGANKELTERVDRLEAELIAKKNIIEALREESDAVKLEYEKQSGVIDEYNENAELFKSRIRELEALVETLKAEVKAKEEQLREQIMLDQREKEREKLLYAEAARLARMEADKQERERIEAEQRERERLEAEAARERAEAEKARAEDEHKKELIRIEREIETQRERKASDLERAKEIRLRMEAEAKEKIGAKYGIENKPQQAAEKPEPMASEPEKKELPGRKDPEIDFSVDDNIPEPEIKEEPKPEAPKTPVYVSKRIKLLFVDAQDVRITEKLRSLIGEVIKKEGKSSVYIKMKASLQDSTTVVLDVIEIPEDETGLLVEMIKHIGSAGLGIYKATLE